MARQPVATNRTPRNVALIVGGLAVVGALLFAAFGLEGPESGPGVDEVAGSPQVEGEALPVLQDPASDVAAGASAPTVVGADFDGEEVAITGEGAEIVVFMASWCPACDAELPELSAFLQEGRLADGVELTSVSTLHDDNRPNWPPQDWFARDDYPGDILVDDADGSVAEAFGLSGTPFWVFLDDGEVVARTSGQLSMDVLESAAIDLVS